MLVSSPRAWGCFWQRICTRTLQPVFPTCVGVFLCNFVGSISCCRLPHVRGGVSKHMVNLGYIRKSSPRAWGCFNSICYKEILHSVFPTCVGVFPGSMTTSFSSVSLPHVRGGVSLISARFGPAASSSPRAWGCFSLPQPPLLAPFVFPTCVGVFLGGIEILYHG